MTSFKIKDNTSIKLNLSSRENKLKESIISKMKLADQTNDDSIKTFLIFLSNYFDSREKILVDLFADENFMRKLIRFLIKSKKRFKKDIKMALTLKKILMFLMGKLNKSQWLFLLEKSVDKLRGLSSLIYARPVMNGSATLKKRLKLDSKEKTKGDYKKITSETIRLIYVCTKYSKLMQMHRISFENALPTLCLFLNFPDIDIFFESVKAFDMILKLMDIHTNNKNEILVRFVGETDWNILSSERINIKKYIKVCSLMANWALCPKIKTKSKLIIGIKLFESLKIYINKNNDLRNFKTLLNYFLKYFEIFNNKQINEILRIFLDKDKNMNFISIKDIETLRKRINNLKKNSGNKETIQFLKTYLINSFKNDFTNGDFFYCLFYLMTFCKSDQNFNSDVNEHNEFFKKLKISATKELKDKNNLITKNFISLFRDGLMSLFRTNSEDLTRVKDITASEVISNLPFYQINSKEDPLKELTLKNVEREKEMGRLREILHSVKKNGFNEEKMTENLLQIILNKNYLNIFEKLELYKILIDKQNNHNFNKNVVSELRLWTKEKWKEENKGFKVGGFFSFLRCHVGKDRDFKEFQSVFQEAIVKVICVLSNVKIWRDHIVKVISDSMNVKNSGENEGVYESLCFIFGKMKKNGDILEGIIKRYNRDFPFCAENEQYNSNFLKFLAGVSFSLGNHERRRAILVKFFLKNIGKERLQPFVFGRIMTLGQINNFDSLKDFLETIPKVHFLTFRYCYRDEKSFEKAAKMLFNQNKNNFLKNYKGEILSGCISKKDRDAMRYLTQILNCELLSLLEQNPLEFSETLIRSKDFEGSLLFVKEFCKEKTSLGSQIYRFIINENRMAQTLYYIVLHGVTKKINFMKMLEFLGINFPGQGGKKEGEKEFVNLLKENVGKIIQFAWKILYKQNSKMGLRSEEPLLVINKIVKSLQGNSFVIAEKVFDILFKVAEKTSENYIPTAVVLNLLFSTCKLSKNYTLEICVLLENATRILNDQNLKEKQKGVELINQIASFCLSREDFLFDENKKLQIPFCPDLNGIVAAQKLLIIENMINTVKIDDKVECFVKSIGNKNAMVKLFVLKKLFLFIRQSHKKLIEEGIVYSVAKNNPNKTNQNPVELLVKTLLSENSNEKRIISWRGKCLGELGAISPSLLNLSGPKKSSNNLCVNANSKSLGIDILNNWILKILKKGLNIQALVSARQIAFEVLHLKEKDFKKYEKEAIEQFKLGVEPKWSNLDLELRSVFKQKIFVNDSYFAENSSKHNSQDYFHNTQSQQEKINESVSIIKMDGSSRNYFSIYLRKNTYSKWITSICALMIDELNRVGSGRSDILRILKPVLKTNEEFCFAIFPLIICEVCSVSGGNLRNLIKEEIKSVLYETVLEDSASFREQNEKNLMAVKTIFNVYTTLNALSVKEQNGNEKIYKKRPKRDSKTRPKNLISKNCKELFNEIPTVFLVRAAIRNQSYETAVYLIEKNWRKDFPKIGPVFIGEEKLLQPELRPEFVKMAHHCYEELDKPDGMSSISLLMKEGAYNEVPLHVQALNFERKEEWQKALECHEQLLHENPQRMPSRKGLVRCLVNLGSLRSALIHVAGAALEGEYVFEQVAELGAEAAWRLQQWGELEELNTKSKGKQSDKSGHSGIFDSLICFKKKNWNDLHELLDRLRIEETRAANLAFSESYARSFPSVAKLTMIREIEKSAEIQNVRSNGNDENDAEIREENDEQMKWNRKLSVFSEKFEMRERLFSLRRVLFGLRDMVESEGESWISLAKEARKAKRFSIAKSALVSAKLMNVNESNLIIEKSKLLFQTGNFAEGLKIIEGNFDEKENESRARLMQAYWTTKTKMKKAVDILSLLKRAEKANKGMKGEEKTHFLLGKYYDYLLSKKKPSKSVSSFYIFSLKHYGKALQLGDKYIFSALPRLISLYVEYSASEKALPDGEGNANRIMDNLANSLSSLQWYTAIPQIISHLGTDSPRFEKLIRKIIIKLFIAFPHQMCWYFLSSAESSVFNRRHNARKILSEVRSHFEENDKQKGELIKQAMDLLVSLLRISKKKMLGNKSKRKLSETFKWFSFEKSFLAALVIPNSFNMDSFSVSHSSKLVTINAIEDTFKVFFSKETPIRICFRGNDGQKYHFMLKVEKKGDIRKDARMNQMLSVVNRLFGKNEATRKRKIILRHFFVALLSENCGLIEWVPNTITFKRACQEIDPSYSLQHCAKICGGTKSLESKNKRKREINFRSLLAAHRPVFGRWLQREFADPKEWMEAQLKFTVSCAATSVFGFLVGLGDRHGENILVDRGSGEIVHVDFDCIFEKGLRLAIPEVVPFRLTQNVLDGFGILGVEHFKILCSFILELFRAEKEVLMSVLDSFVTDPLLEHTRGSEQFRGETAARVMSAVKSRLEGCVDKDGVPLSVRGQIEHLVSVASSFESLSTMFFGWMPSL